MKQPKINIASKVQVTSLGRLYLGDNVVLSLESKEL